MILFPYAGEIEYRDGSLKMVLTFFNSHKTTEMSLEIGLDEHLVETIEGLINQSEEV